MNSYSTEIGKNFINSLPMPRQHAPVDGNTILSLIPTSSFALLTNQSVQDKVNKPKTNKSSGPDDISPKLLKLAGKAIVPALVDIFNYSIERRTVFSSWKTARLTPILKKDDQTDFGNYRPVSLLSVPSKSKRQTGTSCFRGQPVNHRETMGLPTVVATRPSSYWCS